MRKFLIIVVLISLIFTFSGIVFAEGGEIEFTEVFIEQLGAGSFDTWTFDVEAGDVIYLGIFSEDFDVFLRLYDPDGVLIDEDDDSGSDTNAAFWNYPITVTGTYKLELTEYYNTDGGEYYIYFNRIIAAGQLENSQSVQDNISRGDTDAWEFYGTVGDIINISLNSDEFDTYMTLISPENTLLFFNDDLGESSDSGVEEYELLSDGIYTIYAEGYVLDDFGSYTLELSNTDEDPDPIAVLTVIPPENLGSVSELGIEATGNLFSGNASDFYFEAAQGQSLDIAVTSEDFDTVVELFDGDGNLLDYNDDGPDEPNSLIESYVFEEAGTYLISVSGYGDDDSGTFHLFITESFGGEIYIGEILLGDSLVGDLESGFWHSYFFTLSESDTSVTFTLESTDFDTYLELFDPDAELLTSDDDGYGGTDSMIQEYYLSEPGTYFVVASAYTSAESGEYTLTYGTGYEFSGEYQRGPVTSILYNSTGDGYLESEYYDAWQFDGSVGDVVTISVTSDDIDPYTELYGPDGELLIFNDDDGISFNSLIEGFALPTGGTYELWVTGVDFSAVGAYVISITSDSEQPDPDIDIEEGMGIFGLFMDGVIDFSTQITEDEAGIFEIIFLIDSKDADDLTEELEDRDVGNDMEDWCDEVEDIFDDLDNYPKLDDILFDEQEDGFSCSLVFEFDDFDDLEEIYEALGFVDVKDLDIDSDENIDYEVDLEQVDMFAGFIVGEDADIEYLWSITIPGKFGDTNADQVDGKKSVWELDEDDAVEIEMAAEKGGIPPLFLIAGLGLFVLLVGGGIGAFFLIKALRSK